MALPTNKSPIPTYPSLPPRTIEEFDADNTSVLLGKWVVANWPVKDTKTAVLCSMFDTLKKGDFIMLKTIYEHGIFRFPTLTSEFQSDRRGITHSLTEEPFLPEKGVEYRGTVMSTSKHMHMDTMCMNSSEEWEHNSFYYMLDMLIYGEGQTMYHLRLRSQDAMTVVRDDRENWYLNLVVYKWEPAASS